MPGAARLDKIWEALDTAEAAASQGRLLESDQHANWVLGKARDDAKGHAQRLVAHAQRLSNSTARCKNYKRKDIEKLRKLVKCPKIAELHPQAVAKGLLELAWYHLGLGQYENALRHANKARIIAEKRQDTKIAQRRLIQALFGQFLCQCFGQAKYVDAGKTLEKMRELCKARSLRVADGLDSETHTGWANGTDRDDMIAALMYDTGRAWLMHDVGSIKLIGSPEHDRIKECSHALSCALGLFEHALEVARDKTLYDFELDCRYGIACICYKRRDGRQSDIEHAERCYEVLAQKAEVSGHTQYRYLGLAGLLNTYCDADRTHPVDMDKAKKVLNDIIDIENTFKGNWKRAAFIQWGRLAHGWFRWRSVARDEKTAGRAEFKPRDYVAGNESPAGIFKRLLKEDATKGKLLPSVRIHAAIGLGWSCFRGEKIQIAAEKFTAARRLADAQKYLWVKGPAIDGTFLDKIGTIEQLETYLNRHYRVRQAELQKRSEVAKQPSEKEWRKEARKRESFILCLRQWNSYGPLMETGQGKKRNAGGGTFISWRWSEDEPACGIVVDPGHGFIQNLINDDAIKLGTRDINAVIVTHLHLDHMGDLQAIADLYHQYRSYISDTSQLPPDSTSPLVSDNLHNTEERVIHYLLNKTTYSIWDSLQLSPVRPAEGVVHCLEEGEQFIALRDSLGFSLCAMPAAHEELMGWKQAIGIVITLWSHTNKKPLEATSIGFTGDTGWEGLRRGGNKSLDMLANVDVLFANVGTLREDDFRSGYYYRNHLSGKGIITLLQHIIKQRKEGSDPILVLLGEFGQEFHEDVKGFVDNVRQIMNKVDTRGQLRIVPACLGLMVKLISRHGKRQWDPVCPLCVLSGLPDDKCRLGDDDFKKYGAPKCSHPNEHKVTE